MLIGCQTYPVRAEIEKNFIGAIRELANTGYQAVELCSPVGYANTGFAGLAGYKAPELRKILADLGVHCESCHFSMAELRENHDGRIAWATGLGLMQMIVPTLDGPLNPTMDDVKRAADEYNRMAEHSARAGLQQGLHNEGFELSKVDGKRTYDVLLDLLDPQLVKFQFQLSAISQGYDAAEYFMNYPGRFNSMHLQDWSRETKRTVAIGQGALDWNRIFAAAKTGGVKNYFVETPSMESIKASLPYLVSLGF